MSFSWAKKSLQATGAAPSVLDGEGGSLLPSFRLRLATAGHVVASSFPAPVSELCVRPQHAKPL